MLKEVEPRTPVAPLFVHSHLSGLMTLGKLAITKEPSPEAACSMHSSAPNASWAVWSNLPLLQEMMQPTAEDVSQSASQIELPCGVTCAVLAQKVGQLQHRIVLPLLGPEVAALLGDLRVHKMQLRSVALRSRSSCIEVSLPAASATEGLQHVSDVVTDVDELIEQLSLLATNALLDGALPELDSEEVTSIGVTYLYPLALLRALERRDA